MLQSPRIARTIQLATALALSTAPSAAGEISRWTLDDTLQDSVGSNDGTYAGGPAPSFVASHDGSSQGALSLNAAGGLTERVALPEGAGLPIRANARHSVVAWVRGNAGANQVLYSESNAGDSSIVFQIGFDPSGATGKAHILLRDGGAAARIDTILSTTNVLDGTWHHVAWVDDNGSGRMYVDGVLEGQVTYVRPALPLERITIGATSQALSYCCFLKAAVDDVRVFNHALSAAEVQAMVPSLCPPATITDVGPAFVLNVGGTDVTITGRGFVPGEHFGYISDQPLGQQSVTVGSPLSTITGKSPRLPNGRHPVSVRCADGTIAHAAGLVDALPPPSPGINAVAVRPSGGKIADVGGGQVVDVNGIAFTPTMRLSLLDVPSQAETVLAFTFLNSQNLTFITPPHAAGVVDLRAEVDGADRAALHERALEYLLIRPEIRWAVPDIVPAGGAPVVLDGNNFARDMELWMEDAAGHITPLAFTFENALRVYFTAPPHGPGHVALGVREGSKPEFVLPDAIEYLPLPRPCINAVVPRTVSTAGGDEVRVDGVAFHELMELAILDDAGASVLPFRLLGPSLLTFVAPPHAAGLVDLQVSVERQPPCVREDVLLYVAPPTPEIAVSPSSADFGGVLVGDLKSLTLEVRSVGQAPLIVSAVSLAGSTDLSLGTSPAGMTLAPGTSGPLRIDFKPAEFTPASARVRIESNAGRQPVLDLVISGRGVQPPPLDREIVPGPAQIETALAEGTARFSWHNPLPYETILVRDALGTLIEVLPGDTMTYSLSTAGADLVRLELVGTLPGDLLSIPSRATATRHECERPEPLHPPGVSGPIDMFLYGGPDPALFQPVDACLVGAGGESEGGGGAGLGQFISLGDIPPVNGKPQKKGSKGYVVPEAQLPGDLTDPIATPYRNKITTGFILEQPATKLQIDGWYEKIATAFGLELRGRLTLVHAFDPAAEQTFAADFSFPDILISEDPLPCEDGDGGGAGVVPHFQLVETILGLAKKWNGTLFFRADRDPTDPDAQACLDGDGKALELPAGEYLLDLYTVGGDRKLPYYVFSDDLHKEELLIPGVPCPPYPRIRITDMTGLRTLPNITQVVAERVVLFHPNPNLAKDTVVWRALGSWTDENNGHHSIDPSGQGYEETPDFEYTWRFLDFFPHVTKSSGSSNQLEHFVTYGCYKVQVTVRDKACGISQTRTFEVPFRPLSLGCPQSAYDFLYPTPAPEDICAVVNLNTDPPPGSGNFEGTRRVEFRVLVVPRCESGAGGCPQLCPAANLGSTACPDDDSIAFRLARCTSSGDDPDDYIPVPAEIIVRDLCPNNQENAKYFHVLIKDLGEIPVIPGVSPGVFAHVYFQGRGITNGDGESVDGDPWKNIGAPLRLANPPSVLNASYWRGSFDPDEATYHFQVRSADDAEQAFNPGPSREIDILGVAEIPPKNNQVNVGFTARFLAQNGQWLPEPGTGTSSGVVLSNWVDSAPVRVEGTQVVPTPLALVGCEAGAETGGGGGVNPLSAVRYEWCRNEEILHNEFEETLFEAILYSGLIGPIPVEIWASIGLGLEYLVQAQVTTYVDPFKSFTGGNPRVESHFYLLSQVGIRVPCEVRADILGGIGSVSVGLVPEATFELDTHVITQDTQVDPRLFVQALFNLTMYVEGCINLLLAEICAKVEVPIVEDVELLPTVGCCPRPVLTCTNPAGGDYPNCLYSNQADSPCNGLFSFPFFPLQHGGGAGVQAPVAFKVISSPSLASHPDGTKLGIWIGDDDTGHVYVEDMTTPITENANLPWFLIDPSGAFLSGGPNGAAETAIVTFSQSFPHEAVQPWPPAPPLTLAQQNLASATQEILMLRLKKFQQGWAIDSPIDVARISDAASDQGPRRIDGRSAVAGDLHTGEAWVVWVRYDTLDFLIEDGLKTIWDETPEGQICGAPGGGKLCPRQVTNVRPQMELSAIYARKVDYDGPLAPRVKLSPAGINIEPTVAFAPSGQKAYAVWVHDPTHVDLVDSNRGRLFLHSVYDRATDSWSQQALPVWGSAIDPDDYPGLLQPYIALKTDDDGLLAFTALDAGVSLRDTGLGSGRIVFISRLIDGVFQTPELVHGTCDTVQYGEWVTASFRIPTLVEDGPFTMDTPEALLFWHGRGPYGSELGSGDVMAAAVNEIDISFPVSLTNDQNIHSNVAAVVAGGAIQHVNLDAGPATFEGQLALRGAGGGLPTKGYVAASTPLKPDLSILDCKLSQTFPAPGSFVTARVSVENLGLVSSPVDSSGRSACGVRAVYIEEDGTERLAAPIAAVPVLRPGARTSVEIGLEMPLDPVRLRVQIDPNPVDSDLSNNWSTCLFGAPAPREATCVKSLIEPERPRVLLRWTNAADYDEVLVYRNGSMIAALPGRSTVLVDQYCEPGPLLYAVRGRIGPSKSSRTLCDVEPPGVQFIRADANADGKVDISDPVYTLARLFLGGPAHACVASADANGDLRVDISDPVYTLSHLFLGGPAPARPYPGCGTDPESDRLGCESFDGCQER